MEWWNEISTLVKHHKTLKAVAFAFTRPRPLIAHNVMERSLAQRPEILEQLMVSKYKANGECASRIWKAL